MFCSLSTWFKKVQHFTQTQINSQTQKKPTDAMPQHAWSLERFVPKRLFSESQTVSLLESTLQFNVVWDAGSHRSDIITVHYTDEWCSFFSLPPPVCGWLHSSLMKLLFVSGAILLAPGTACFYTSVAGLWFRVWAWGQRRLSALHGTYGQPCLI